MSTRTPSLVAAELRPAASMAFMVTKYMVLLIKDKQLMVMLFAFPKFFQGTTMFPLAFDTLYSYLTIPLPLIPSVKPFQFAVMLVLSDW